VTAPPRPASFFARVIQPFLSPRFLKFAAVGASGVVVNLGVLALALGPLGLRSTAASVLAIEISVLSNFVINERWTFADQHEGAWPARLLRFQLVSLVGALVQFAVFLAGNVLALAALGAEGALADYFAQAGQAVGPIQRYLLHPIVDPPEVGAWVYVSQLAGIGVATAWNFLANLRWTWGHKAA
jgi:putative flippase GtrA